jgi:hypothetical protein
MRTGQRIVTVHAITFRNLLLGGRIADSAGCKRVFVVGRDCRMA